MKKHEILAHWEGLEPNQEVAMSEVPYKHKGSTYDQDGIRLTGSKRFIDSVLSNLKGLLDYENGESRLQVVYQESRDRDTQGLTGTYNCYIQVHERGHEAKMCNAFVEGAKTRNFARYNGMAQDMIETAMNR